MELRRYTPEDAKLVVSLSRAAYQDPKIEPWTVEEVQEHAARFPDGQLLIEEAGRPLASCSSLILPRELALDPEHTWTQATGDGTFSTHDPRGSVLYAADIVVHPDHRGRGLAQRLYAERRRLCRELGLDGIAAGGRLYGYHRVEDELGPRAYVDRVRTGDLADPVLTFQLKQGFEVRGILCHYFPDRRGKGHAAHIWWGRPSSEG